MTTFDYRNDEVVKAMKQESTITNLVGARVYDWPPKSKQDGIFVVVDWISQVTAVNWIEKRQRVSCTINWLNTDTSRSSLRAVYKAIRSYLVWTAQTFGEQEAYKVTEWGYLETRDNLGINIIVTDYLFRFIY